MAEIITKVEFTEQSKAVVADAKVEIKMTVEDYEVLGEKLINLRELILEESKKLFEQASLYSAVKTIEKTR